MSRTNNEYLYYATLKRIAKDYMTLAQLRRSANDTYALPYEETLEMVYGNVKAEAAAAIHGKRCPKPPVPVPAKEPRQ